MGYLKPLLKSNINAGYRENLCTCNVYYLSEEQKMINTAYLISTNPIIVLLA